MPRDRAVPARHEGKKGRPGLALAALLGVLGAGALSTLAWTSPPRAPLVVAYTQSGHLSYSAKVSPSSIYGRAGLVTGEPVYTSQVRALEISYNYRFSAAASTRLAGSEQLVATISNGQGVTRRLPLQRPTSFTGGHFRADGSLDLLAVRAVASAFDNAMAGAPAGSYTVSISPSVHIYGRVGYSPLDTTFNAPVEFTYSPQALTPDASSPAPSGVGGTAPGLGASNGGNQTFNPSSSGSVVVASGRPATLAFGIGVASARLLAPAALLVLLLVAGFAGVPLLRQVGSDEEAVRIAARHRASLVEADTLPSYPVVAVVDINSFEGLLQVARRLECPVLHEGLESDTYAVVDNGTLYRYRIDPGGEHQGGAESSERSTEEGAHRPRFAASA